MPARHSEVDARPAARRPEDTAPRPARKPHRPLSLATRHRLALLAAAAVAFAMLAAALTFTQFIRAKIENDALAAIERALGWDANEAEVERSVYYVPLDDPDEMSLSEWYTDEEKALVAWARGMSERDTIKRVELLGQVFYATIVPVGSWTSSFATDEYEAVVYVDVSGEEELVVDVNGALAIIGVVGAAVAAVAAYVAGRRIEAAEEARKRFYENMSHELKTPLAAIQGYAEGIEAGVVEPRAAAQAIVGESQRASDLVGSILGLARIDAGAVELHREPVEVADLVQDCLMPFEGIVRTRGLDVQLELADGEIEADPNLLGHALENLLSNAVRHAATTLRVSYDGAVLAFWNDGEMPEPDAVPRLFDRYRTGAGGSTGIGLALAREIVSLHGWRLTAELVDGGMRMAISFA